MHLYGIKSFAGGARSPAPRPGLGAMHSGYGGSWGTISGWTPATAYAPVATSGGPGDVDGLEYTHGRAAALAYLQAARPPYAYGPTSPPPGHTPAWVKGWQMSFSTSPAFGAQKTAQGFGTILLGLLVTVLVAGGIAFAVAVYYAQKILGAFQAHGIVPLPPGHGFPPGSVPCDPNAVLSAVSEVLGPEDGASFLSLATKEYGWTYACVPAQPQPQQQPALFPQS
jgi:hypothetical protein